MYLLFNPHLDAIDYYSREQLFKKPDYLIVVK